MDTFSAIVFVSLAAGLLWVVLAGWVSRDRPVGELIDKCRDERWSAQMDVEQHDLAQMVAAANDYRRKRGLSPVTLEQVQARAGQDLRDEIVEQASTAPC